MPLINIKKIYIICIGLLLFISCATPRTISTQSQTINLDAKTDNSISETEQPSEPPNEVSNSVSTEVPVITPLPLDDTIKSITISNKVFQQFYKDPFLFPESMVEINPDAIIDTFNTPPLFSVDAEITLSQGQTEVIITDESGEWPPIHIEFFDSSEN
jgi:hypothetical protein